MSRLPQLDRWARSSKEPSSIIFTLRMCMKAMRPMAEYLRTMAATSLLLAQPRLPVHRHRQLAGESTSLRNRSRLASQVMMRGRPKMGYGGSSGWMAIFTPHSSATGMTFLRNRSRLAHRPSSPISP